MNLSTFCEIASTYYSIDCETDNEEVIDAAYTLLKVSYSKLSKGEKDIVNTLCDARLTDIL